LKTIKSHEVRVLRIIAVLAVFLFHLYPQSLNFLYLGVDIFFVISGYLLIPRIVESLEASPRFSALKPFYVSRFLRIFPTFIASIIIIYCIFFSFGNYFDLSSVKSNLLPTIFLFSDLNYVFNKQNYFVTNPSPVLHMWSIGVEIKFYILTPALFWMGKRLGIRIILLMQFSFFISLAFFMLYVKDQSPLYFFFVSRYFEFILGGMLRLKNSSARNLMLLIVLSLVPFANVTQRPILLAILSTSLILSIPQNIKFTKRQNQVVDYVSNLTYSFFLIHPICIFLVRDSMISEFIPHLLKPFMVMTISSLLSIFLWNNIDRVYFRKEPVQVGLLLFCVVASLSLITISLFSTKVLEFVYKSSMVNQFALSRPDDVWCKERLYSIKPCFYTNGVRDSEVVTIVDRILIGDSHALQYSNFFIQLSAIENSSLAILATEGCRIVKSRSDFSENDCEKAREVVFDSLDNFKIKEVILGQRFFGDESLIEIEEFFARLYPEFNLRIIGRTPIFPMNRASPLQRPFWASNQIAIGTRLTDMNSSGADFAEKVRLLATRLGIDYIDVDSSVCQGRYCLPYSEGVWLYYDDNHLNIPGANIVLSRTEKFKFPQ